jgi:hypothetical protein
VVLPGAPVPLKPGPCRTLPSLQTKESRGLEVEGRTGEDGDSPTKWPGYGRVFLKQSQTRARARMRLVKTGINPNKTLTAGPGGRWTEAGALGAINLLLSISTGDPASTDDLGMNGSVTGPPVHLRPRSRPAHRAAIENDAPFCLDGALTAPGLIHRSLEIMDSRR